MRTHSTHHAPATPLHRLQRRWLLCALVGAAPALCPRAAQAQAQQREALALELSLEAAADINPDDKARPSPLLVRLYELKNDAAFKEADYFSLYDKDRTLLGADLLARDEFILRPGQAQRIARKTHPETVALGLLAGYRDLAGSVWRHVITLDPAPEAALWRLVMPAHKARYQVTLSSNAIQVSQPPK